MGAGTARIGERTLHHPPHRDENRPNSMASRQEGGRTPNHHEQIETTHDRNRTSFDQSPCQDGAGIDRHTKQTSGRATASQKGTTCPQGTSDTFAKSAAYTEQALAKFEHCLRELTALVGKVEQYIAEKLMEKQSIKEKSVHYTRLRM